MALFCLLLVFSDNILAIFHKFLLALLAGDCMKSSTLEQKPFKANKVVIEEIYW